MRGRLGNRHVVGRGGAPLETVQNHLLVATLLHPLIFVGAEGGAAQEP
jgi:hypothetical protein